MTDNQSSQSPPPVPAGQNPPPTAGGSASTSSAPDLSLSSFMRGDVALALGVVAVLVVLILPMPPWLLDSALALSMGFSVMVLMTVLFIHKPLEFSSFPTVLLIATMIRLSLNMASTRLILGKGHEGEAAAGEVIKAFGGFLASGNYVIGVIVFTILVIVNFVVITKGSGRIAEVAARFNLDAMPGKQMAIDADLSSGLINEDEARERRKNLEQESTFFGAMDGAAKFVRGDAIAGILITFINIIGGIIIGTVQKDLTIGDAASTYTLLTIGDGLVSQIPALIVSIAAGLLVTKAGISGSTDRALVDQMSFYPRALGVTAVLLVAVGLLPGIPFLPFFILSGLFGFLAYSSAQRKQQNAAKEKAKTAQTKQAAKPAEEPISQTLAMDIIRLELGYGLLPLVNKETGSKLTEQVKGLRRQLAEEMGFVLPSVRIQDNLQLPANTYVVRVKEIESGRGEVRPNMLMCMDPAGKDINLPGEKTKEPTFGLPAMWIDEANREEAQFNGHTVVDPSTVITTHLTELVKDNMAELLSYTETQKLLDEMGDAHQKMIADLIPAQITIGNLQRVLQNLLSERISIRDLPAIVEAVAECAQSNRNIHIITEHVRMRLSRQICDTNANVLGMIPLLTLSPEWEQAFSQSLVGEGDDKSLSMPPSQLQDFIMKVKTLYEQMSAKGENPVLLTGPYIRPYVRSIVERFRPQTTVMSQSEIHPKAKIKTLGQVT
jgi:flagellar biosynthesis protein FlhA